MTENKKSNHEAKKLEVQPEKASYYVIEGALTEIICDGEWVAYADNEAYARRIAACWNACVGIKTETLEHLPASLKVALKDAEEDCSTLATERDDALALLRELVDLDDGGDIADTCIDFGVTSGSMRDLLKRIRTLLAE